MGEPPDDLAQLRRPPHSMEAEQSVLGGLMLDNRAFDRVPPEALQPGVFYSFDHQRIMAALLRLLTACKPADVLTVYDEMRRADQKVGKQELVYLNELAQSVASAANIHRYAAIVLDHARCRQTIAIANELAAAAYNPGTLQPAWDTAMSAILALQQGQGDNNPRELQGLLAPWLDDLQARADGEIDAIPTGLAECDELFAGGLRAGELVVIGSRPSMGKTGLGHTLSRNMARSAPVLVCSMEDSLQMLVSRNVASVGRLNLADIRNPQRAKAGLWEGVARGVDVLGKLPIYVDDQPALNLREVRRKATFVRVHAGSLGTVIVDYLQLMDEPGEESRSYELNRIARGLKRLAKELQCVVVLLSQLSRKADETEAPPRLDHLAESGGIEQAADIIGLLHRAYRRRPTEDNKHRGQVEWAKNKNGPTGTVQLWYDGATQRWENQASEPAHG